MQEMRSGSVDLIYLDPPFNSARDYNAIYKDETGRPLPDQIEAFCDTWKLDSERERSLKTMPVLMQENGIDDDVAEFWRLWMNALRKTNSALLSYLVYMTERLLPMKRLLKPTGSIYLHCDPTASHYIKVMMDAIFGHKHFQNEIIWGYETGGRSKKRFSRKHDTILFYSKTKKIRFNSEAIGIVRGHKKRNNMKRNIDKDGRVFYSIKSNDKIYKYYEDEKMTPSDVWYDISHLNQRDPERLGYSTQKPLKLLERIIKASSNEGDVVFDPFCGCATTIETAHKLNRKWIGVDIAIHAVKRVAGVRLQDRLGLVEGKDYIIEGIPRTIEGARDLWERDKYHFQKWAVEQVDGFVTNRKTADGGIDGRLYFEYDKDLTSMIIEVKGGKNVGINTIRDLRGALEREGESVKMAALIVLEQLGDRKLNNFKKEMAQAGDIDYHGIKYERMQILTIADILDGKRFNTPSRVVGRGLAEPSLPLG